MRPSEIARLRSFYHEVISKMGTTESDNKIALIVVSHVIPHKAVLLDALRKIGRVAAVIPKASVHESTTRSEMESTYHEVFRADITKEILREPANAIKFIKSTIRPDEKFIIIDIGGYFAPALPNISHDPEIGNMLIGIVEGTANGHHKYEQTVAKCRHPVFSKAFSPLKSPEDYKVGLSIVRSADMVIRDSDDQTIENLHQYGIIGFGKIGRSIAQHLPHGKQIMVYDHDPETLAMASAMSLEIAPKRHIIQNADALFLATGNRSMADDDFAAMKSGSYVISCTSADDEIDISTLAANATESEHKGINTFTSPNGHEVNLLHRGNSVNFKHKAVIGAEIYLIMAEFLADAIKLIQGEHPAVNDNSATRQLLALPKTDRNIIAEAWIRMYTAFNTAEVDPTAKPITLQGLAALSAVRQARERN